MLFGILFGVMLIVVLISGYYYVKAHLYGEVRLELAAIFYGGLLLLILLALFQILF